MESLSQQFAEALDSELSFAVQAYENAMHANEEMYDAIDDSQSDRALIAAVNALECTSSRGDCYDAFAGTHSDETYTEVLNVDESRVTAAAGDPLESGEWSQSDDLTLLCPSWDDGGVPDSILLAAVEAIEESLVMTTVHPADSLEFTQSDAALIAAVESIEVAQRGACSHYSLVDDTQRGASSLIVMDTAPPTVRGLSTSGPLDASRASNRDDGKRLK